MWVDAVWVWAGPSGLSLGSAVLWWEVGALTDTEPAGGKDDGNGGVEM